MYLLYYIQASLTTDIHVGYCEGLGVHHHDWAAGDAVRGREDDLPENSSRLRDKRRLALLVLAVSLLILVDLILSTTCSWM